MFALGFIFVEEGGGSAVDELRQWNRNALMLGPFGNVVSDTDAVATWRATDLVTEFRQTDPEQRPDADLDALPGRKAFIALGDDHLTGTIGFIPGTFLIITNAPTGSRTVIGQDTTATTTKPAWKLVIEEYTAGGSTDRLIDDEGDFLVDDEGDFLSAV